MREQFYYFDGLEERQRVIEQVRDVRARVAGIAAQIPEQHHFIPRYRGRSLAVTLTHLYLFDRAALWFIDTSADLRDDLRLKIPKHLIRVTDHVLLRFFQRRRVSTTLADLQRMEERICTYIETVPVGVLHKDVCHPGRYEPYTVEKALQVYFVHYWERYAEVMQQVEGLPEDSSV